MDLDLTKTEVQLLSKSRAVEIKAFAVTGTIKERVEWCSQHSDYIRANRPSYYYSAIQMLEEQKYWTQMKFVTNSLESTFSKIQDINQQTITFHSTNSQSTITEKIRT